jgi:hypothetical protein
VQLLALPTGLRELEERYSFTPSDLAVLERLTIAARSRARRKAYRALNGDLTFEQRQHLDRFLITRKIFHDTSTFYFDKAMYFYFLPKGKVLASLATCGNA